MIRDGAIEHEALLPHPPERGVPGAGRSGRTERVYNCNGGCHLESLRLFCTTGTGKPFQARSR